MEARLLAQPQDTLPGEVVLQGGLVPGAGGGVQGQGHRTYLARTGRYSPSSLLCHQWLLSRSSVKVYTYFLALGWLMSPILATGTTLYWSPLPLQYWGGN